MDPEFDELKRDFLEEASAKVKEIAALLERDGIGDLAARERALYLAHQLKGAGGSYGFSSISTEAAGLETDLERGEGRFDAAAVRTRLGRLVAVIRERIEELETA
ncbi:MAG TPA: Hpt domain-containing protein [Thermoanaerobaculia bacterium]|nr:Hpt domain-containing protein [Thermoanaerobaculia bacterium]